MLSVFTIALSQTAPRIVPEPPIGKGVVVLKAARLIDGTGAPAIINAVVVIEDNKITAAGSARTINIPANAKMIDLGDATLLPGFIDAHTHLIGRTLGDPAGDNAPVRDYESFAAILGVQNARATLMAGFTTVRNVGAGGRFDDMALRKAIDEGWTQGPRMVTAGHALGMRGGHCDENGFRPGLFDPGIEEGVADGPDQIRAAVRYQIKYGADVIKTCATGGVLSEGDAVGVPQYTYEELKAHKPDLPTLTEALELVNQRVPVIIEIKPKEPTHEVIRIVHSFMDRGWGPADLLFVSFDYRILKELHTAFPAHTIIVDEIWSGVRAASRARRLDSRDISIYAPFIWGGFIRAFTRRGYRLYAFPMNDPKKARKWAKLGFYAAITDYPDRFET